MNLAGVRRSHPVIGVLSDDDQDLVVAACASGAVSARDAAITLLALTTGLRACDIVALRLADVDWRGQTISIVQQKTGNPLTLPLPALVMGRLAGYVLDERPGSADDHVFLRSVAPHVRLADHASVHRVITETFRKAGVTDVNAGTRFLRHNAASRLLRAAVPLPTISAVLGHASQESTNVYMSVDRERLLDCVLAGSRRSTVMSGRGFTSAFAAELDAYLAFKQNMGFYGSFPHLVPAEVRRLVRRARPDRLRPGHRRGMGERPAGKLGPLPVVDVLHPRLRPVASGHRGQRRLRAVRPVESPVRSAAPLPAERAGDRAVLHSGSGTASPSPRGGGRRSRSSR